MILRLFTAAVFCCSVFAVVPALEATADTAYLIVTQPGSNPVLAGWNQIINNTGPGSISSTPAPNPTNGVVVSHEYKLENFSIIQTTAAATGSAAGGKAQPISFKATTPVDGTSDQLVSLSNAIPELTVRLEGSSATDTFAFRNCRRTSTAPTAAKTPSIPLSFTCASSTFSSQTQLGKANPSTSTAGGSPASAPRAKGVEAYLDLGGAPIHLTSFAADPATAVVIGSKAGIDAGKATTGTLQISLPLDGSGKAIASLAGHGDAATPLTVTIVATGDPVSKPLAVERFSPWRVESMATGFADSAAATDFQITYGAMTVLKKSSGTMSAPTPSGWNTIKNAPSGSTPIKQP